MKDACLTGYALLLCEARTLLSVLDDPLAIGWYLFPNHKDGSTTREIEMILKLSSRSNRNLYSPFTDWLGLNIYKKRAILADCLRSWNLETPTFSHEMQRLHPMPMPMIYKPNLEGSQ